MIAGLMGATVVVFSKKVSKKYSETQILTTIFVVMFLANFLFSQILKEPALEFSLSVSWLAQFGYSLSMVLANTAVIVGYKYLEPSIGGLIGLLEVIFAVLFGIIFFREGAQLSTMIGGMLILVSVALPDFWEICKRKFKPYS